LSNEDRTAAQPSRPRLNFLRGLFSRRSPEPRGDLKKQASEPDLTPENVLAINFVAEAGKQMLESSTSVSEVLDRLRGFLPAVGLEGAALDANLGTLTLSYWKPGQSAPLTTMQVIDVRQPRLERFTGTVSLLERVERGEIELAAAYEELQSLRRAPAAARRYGRVAILVSVLGWVFFLNGLNLTTILIALLATLLTFPVDAVVRRLNMPNVTGTILAAIILAAVPNLLAGAGLSFSLSAAVVGGLFIYLPGRAFVSAVIDGLANAPVSAMTRGFEAILTAGALAFGVVIGGRIGSGLGVELNIDTHAAPLWLSILGAAIGVFGLAMAWGMPRTRVVPSVAIGAVGWLIVALATREAIGSGWPAYFAAAVLVGFFGALVALLQGGSASVYTGVAILPLVPGFTLYQGMLALTHATNTGASGKLADAAVISLAIAGGVAVGLALGRNLQAMGGWITARRQKRASSGPSSPPPS